MHITVIYALRHCMCVQQCQCNCCLVLSPPKGGAELVTYACKYDNNVKQLYHSLCSVPITETSFNLWPVMLQLCMTTLSFNLASSQNTPLEVQALRYHNKAKQNIDSALFPPVALWFSVVSVKL
jgi:hypothetical protein